MKIPNDRGDFNIRKAGEFSLLQIKRVPFYSFRFFYREISPISLAFEEPGYCILRQIWPYETWNRNEIPITMVKGFHDLLVSRRGQMWQPPCHHTPGILETAQALFPSRIWWVSSHPHCCQHSRLLHAAPYMSSHHFQPTSSHPAQIACN